MICNQRSQPVHYAVLISRGVLKIYIAIHEAVKYPGDILLPWNFASVLKPHTHHHEYLQPLIEQKPTTTGLIIYKHATCTKLRHLTGDKSKGKLPNPCGNRRKSWNHLTPSFPWLTPESKKTKTIDFIRGLISFSYTRNKKNSSTR